jgi:TolB protein
MPDWSPDGKRLVFTRRCNTLENCTSQQDLYTMDVDGKNLKRLTDSFINEFLPVWSPDGSRIAFVLGNQKGSSIYSVDSSGNNRQLFGDSETNVSMPAWSPDGTHMAYVHWDPKTYQSDLYVATVDGASPRRLTFENASVNQPSWSPDGATIVFSLRRPDATAENLWLVPVDGSFEPVALTWGSQNDTRPAWGR